MILLAHVSLVIGMEGRLGIKMGNGLKMISADFDLPIGLNLSQQFNPKCVELGRGSNDEEQASRDHRRDASRTA